MVRETRHLWVANLPDNTREDRIREHFQRYGRVQSVKIITSGTVSSNATTESSDHHLSSSSTTHHHHLHHLSKTHNTNTNCVSPIGSTESQKSTNGTNALGVTVTSCSVSNNVSSSNQSSGGNNSSSSGSITVCATIAFMDIKSASKAHLAEHKFDDRILTTEYYEPSAMQHGSTNEGSSSNLVINNKMMNESSDTKQEHGHGRYASTSSHGSSDDHSPGYDRTSFYDRVNTSQIGNRASETTTEFIRRNSYHSNDRGRQRDRQHFRNSPYSLIVDRSNQISHHRLTSNTWYETSPSSTSSSRNHYSNNQTGLGNSNSTVFQQPDSSYDRHNSSDLSDHQTSSSPNAVVTTSNSLKDTSKLLSNNTTTITTQQQALLSNIEPPYKSKLLVNNHHHHNSKSIKSRSGSESPISNRSSRSHSRSPSSCSSTHSSSHTTTPTSSRDSNASPISGNTGDLLIHNTPSSHHHSTSHHRHLKSDNSASKSHSGSSHHSQRHRRNLQASLSSIPLQNVSTTPCIDKPASTSSLSSTGSFSGSNSLGFYSEDNRPLAICVRNLPLRSSDTSLKDGLFHEYKKHGKVTWVKVVGQNHDRYALVCFKKPEDVDKALEVSQDKLFFGCKIEVQSYQGYDVDDNEFRPYEAELDEYQPKSTRTLFIGNLEKDITVTELRKHFECFGEILEIDIKKQGSTPYAFCQYADIVSVVKAVRKMDGEHLGSTRIKLGFGKSMPTTCVWFDGIAESVTEHYLSQQCSRYGVVQKVTIDHERRMALVTFDQIQSAQQAVKEMRGIPMRGRKLQVDFASRECIDAFYGRMENKHVNSSTVTATTTTNNINYEMSLATNNSTAGATTTTSVGNRYLSSLSRSRASSFSRPGNHLSGTASPTSTPSAGSTPRHLSSSNVSRKFRYVAGSPEFYDSNEYLDSYSNFDHERGIDSDHLNANDSESLLTRRRCDKSPVGDNRQVQRGESEGPGLRRRIERSPGEMRILESQRHKILDQLEKCPSSGDEAESPKKRAKYSHDLDDHHNHNNHHDSSTTCNGKILDHREPSSYSSYNHHHHRYHHHNSELAHRKTVEIRRLSDCNIKHSASVPGGAMTSNYTKPNRRPSTDSLSRYSTTTAAAQMENYQLHKRRKTSAGASTSSSSSSMTANELELKNRTHPIQSFDDDGAGDSEHGSRPDTPLFDERPDNAPVDPRTNRPRLPRELLNLPLPKFAQGFHQQLRQNNQLLPASHANLNTDKYENSGIVSAFSHHSSLKHKSISPSPQHAVRSRSNSIMPPVSSGSSISETLLTSPRPPSLTSNSSDSEQELSSIAGPSTSPSLEERLKKLSEDYDSWSSNGRSSSSSHYMNNMRHAVPEISIPETPELLLKNVLKNSMFDEDSKRLENINTQPPPTPSANVKSNFGSFNSSHLSGTSSPLINMCSIASNSLEHTNALTKIQVPMQQQQPQPQQPIITTMLQHRLGSSSTGSPMHSPNTASPYNSPNPSSASSISSIKGLQYPFPSHPTTSSTNSNSSISNIPAALNAASSTSLSNTHTIATCTNTSSTASSSQQQKPKTCTLNKSISLQEVAVTTGNNNNNFNTSFNKSSTNNINNSNNNNDNPATITTSTTLSNKQLVKSVSLPSCTENSVQHQTLSSESNNSNKIEKIEESESETTNENCKNEETVKSAEFGEKKNHGKERRKNSEQLDEHIHNNDGTKEHLKKEKDGFRKEKEKESKKTRDVEDKKSKAESTVTQKSSKKLREESSIEEKKEEQLFERAPSPNAVQRKRQTSTNDDLSSIDSSVELSSNHLQEKKDAKHHESKNNSKHHHHAHKERKNSLKDKLHSEDDTHLNKLKQSDVHSSKDSIFDELKRNTKDNIIKNNDKLHKTKKHHHHRDNGNKDKENQTQPVHHHFDQSNAMTQDDVINRSSEDDSTIRHNHNGRKQDHLSEDNEKKHDEHNSKSNDENNGKKKYQRRNLLNASISTDETEDSDGNGKRVSFFDIPDDGPNISMYDKVKARSCKNLKKQEEEKKIKDKFTALKQSRAKREKKRLNTSEDDSDSDIHDTNSNDMFSTKYKKSHLSASDDELRDSDDEVLSKKSKNRNQLSICDDESSESGINVHDGHRKRNKIFNRKSSRTNVIDSSDEEMHLPTKVEIKQEPTSAVDSFDELRKQDHETTKNNKHSSKKRHHEKTNKEDKLNKKSKKLAKEHHRKSTSSTDSMQKREEDIFGSVTEEDDQQQHKTESKNELIVTLTEIKKEKLDESIESDTTNDVQSKERPREESKKRKRERRREREKQRSIIKEEENSVDLDEAGRALEAQLMSDSDHKINNNEINSKELKPDDVFHFTDDEIKRDHHDSIKKKKKKKRTKEEKKHHHNHHHYENIKQEPIDTENTGAFNNNNNTKMKLEVVVDDLKLKPSVPSLTSVDDAKVEIQETLLSPTSQVKNETKVKTEMTTTIPGFGGIPIDEKIHEKAVMSLAAELEKKPDEIIEIHEKKPIKVENEKPEEKSRVVISQEETEDAVAALLGESFSMTHEDYNDPYDDVPMVTSETDNMENINEPAVIPPEEDEEMKKAIMSLNSEIDRKIDTPQSEHDHDLQIDTDTEEPVEEENINSQPISFDEPPKTPDLVEKDKLDSSDVSDKSLKIDESPREEEETKVEEKPIENVEIKSESSNIIEKEKKEIVEKVEVAKKHQNFHPTSIIIPEPQPISSPVEKTSPRKQQQQSPGAIKPGPLYSPITPLSGKDSQTTIFSTITSKLPATSSASITNAPKIIGIPGKTDNKPILHSPNTTNIKLPSPVQQSAKPTENKEQNIQMIPKYTPVTAAERKMEQKPPQTKAQANHQNIRQPQILYPPNVQPPQQTQQNSVIQKMVDVKETEQPKIEKKEQLAQLDTSHEEEENDSTPPDNSMEKEIGTAKKTTRGAGKQRGRKSANANVQMPSSPSSSHQLEDVPSSPQTRRGGKTATASKRGRGAKATNAKVIQPIPTSVQQIISPPVSSQNQQQTPMQQIPGLRQQKISESDVYEFHDDSGEELMKKGDQRPRLIMTIKSTASTTTTVAQPIVSQSTTIQAPLTVASNVSNQPQTSITPIATTIASTPSQPSQPVTEAVHELTIPPSPSQNQEPSPAQSDEFAQPNNNTRKSKRLLEKDGPRTSVDDTIDDVIRNVNLVAPQNQQQQQSMPANSRTTRATRQNAIPQVNVPTSNPLIPPTQQQQSMPQAVPVAHVETKKQGRPCNSKKQKDRKTSETSESETEKKIEKQQIIQPVQQVINIDSSHQLPPPIIQIPVSEAPKIIQIPTTQPAIIKPPSHHEQQQQHILPIVQQKKEGAELLQLIDPVTGELQKMTQSKEGQYVPVSEHKAQMIPISQQQQTVYHVESKQQEEKKIISISTNPNVIKTSTPVIIEPPKGPISLNISEQPKPVITQNPQAAAYKPVNKYIYSTQNLTKAPSTIVNAMSNSNPLATVISSQAKTNVPTGIVHPPTIYNLPIPNTKYIAQPPMQTQQKTIVMQPHSNQPTTIIHSSATSVAQAQPKPQIIHQKAPVTMPQPQIVIHPQTHQIHHQQQSQQTSSGNLMINIPTSSAAQNQSIPSPSRMTVKQVIQRTVPQQMQQQQPTVVVKSTQPPQSPLQQHHTIMTNQDVSKSSARTTYIPTGTKIVETSMNYPGNHEVIYVEGKRTMFPNYQAKYHQPVPSPTQTKPLQQIVQQIPIQNQQIVTQSSQPQQIQSTTQQKIIEKIPGQPQVSVQHIPHQQKVYITGPQVITSQAQLQSEQIGERAQQWLTHEKMTPQALKQRFVMDFEEAQRNSQSQQQQQASPHMRKPTYVIETTSTHPTHPPNVVSHQGKTIIGLNQAPQILTGAVASPPLKAHMSSQQPIVTGASSSRIAVPTASPKDLPQRHYPPEAYEEVMRPPYLMTTKLYPQPAMYMRGSEFSRLPIPRIGHSGPTESQEMEEQPRTASPPLELRRTTSMSLQSPSDRITDSPMMAPLYLSPRIPQPYYFEGEAMKPLPNAEPPPAHRSHATSANAYTQQPQNTALPPPPPSSSVNLAHIQQQQREREKDESVQIVYSSSGPPAQVPLVAPISNPRTIQMATPPIASQVPPHADTLSRLLERYPLMWQGLLALKTEQAAVQMHFVHGNKKIAKASLPFNADATTPPLRIAQRMRLEPSQIDGVSRKMMIEDEHCVLLALPCGFDYSDVLRQTENLQVSFINYLQLKQAAGIINIADSGSQNASYVVHIFPSCDFANESLKSIAPDLMMKVANIAYLLIVIATV
ncbi:hypothetical protein PVAND_004913 [Polypedilum vanderplanki]|uniref:Protein split ends n=1 Tax=Polypedilum vanderplanki TaxID=319348 RepID=A0A9J6BYB6_POLVA|nr:hypothetical protein PVAND_004913 [Polypedilum vanderplanki]